MARVNVWIPQSLAETIRDQMPGVNVSSVLQEGLRRLLECKHSQAVCGACAEGIDLVQVALKAKGELYTQLLWEIQDLIAAGGTAEGAARVAKGVALAHGVPEARYRPLPRPSRTAVRRRMEAEWVASQAAATM